MQRYFAKEKKDNEFILLDDDLRHIKTVMRMNDNDEIEVVYNEKVYLCCLKNVKQNVKICVKNELKTNIKRLDVCLIIPVLKEQKMDYILQKATELGVSEIIPVITERTIVKLDEKSSLKKIERWQKICKEASEQSKRIDIPLVKNIVKLKDIEVSDGINLVCSTFVSSTIKKYFQNKNLCDKINIVIGPEGGLSIKEEELLNEKGFESISLGERILRVETAPLVILSMLNYINME